MIEEIKKMLWASADKLRANMDPAEYKHIVLGLIFLKYISDSFQTHRMQLTLRFQDSDDDYYLSDTNKYYLEKITFYVSEDRVIVERGKEKQVEAVFYSGELEKKND